MSNDKWINIVLVSLDGENGLNAVFQAPPYATVNVGDHVDDFNGVTGTVLSVLYAERGGNYHQFITACFGTNEELPKLKGRTVYYEFAYSEDPEPEEAQHHD